MVVSVTVWVQIGFRWRRAGLLRSRALSAVLAFGIVHFLGCVGASAAIYTATSVPVRLRPGEASLSIQVPQFDPRVHPDAPVLQQVVFSVSATFTAGIRLTDSVHSNSAISYVLGPAVISIHPVSSNRLALALMSLNLTGTNFPTSGDAAPILVQTVGQQMVSYTNSTDIGYFVGTNSRLYDVDFLALYPPFMKTDRISANALFHDDAAVVSLAVEYNSSPSLAVLGPTHFVYNGGPQGPTNVFLVGAPRSVSFVYQGVAGTDYGPSPQAPKNVGAFAAIASVEADGTNPPATTDPFQFQIDPAPLSLVALAVRKPYGTTLLPFDLTHAFAATGLQGADRIASVTAKAGAGMQAGSPEGIYSYTISDAFGPRFDGSNYSINYFPGLLTVIPPIPKIISTGDQKGIVTVKPMVPEIPGSTSSAKSIGFAVTVTAGTRVPVLASSSPVEPVDPQTDVPLLPGWALLGISLFVVASGAMQIRSGRFFPAS